MANVGELNVRIGGDASELNRAVEGALKKLEGFGNAIKEVSQQSIIAFSAMAAASVMIGKEFVNIASDAGELQNVIQTTFGESTNDINRWAADSGKAMGRFSQDVLAGVGSFGAMVKGMGATPEVTEQVSKGFAQLAIDLGSFWNVSDDIARQDLKSLLAGQSDAMYKYGVVATEGALATYALSEGYSTLYKDMDTAEKTMVRFNFVMNATKDAQGDAEKTILGFANQTKVLEANIKELELSIGTQLLPTLNKMLIEFNNIDFDKIFKSLDLGKIGTIIAGVFGIVGAFAAVGVSIFLLTNPLIALVAASALAAGAMSTNFLGVKTVFDSIILSFDKIVKKMELLKGGKVNAFEAQTLTDYEGNITKVQKLIELSKDKDFFIKLKKDPELENFFKLMEKSGIIKLDIQTTNYQNKSIKDQSEKEQQARVQAIIDADKKASKLPWQDGTEKGLLKSLDEKLFNVLEIKNKKVETPAERAQNKETEKFAVKDLSLQLGKASLYFGDKIEVDSKPLADKAGEEIKKAMDDVFKGVNSVEYVKTLTEMFNFDTVFETIIAGFVNAGKLTTEGAKKLKAAMKNNLPEKPASIATQTTAQQPTQETTLPPIPAFESNTAGGTRREVLERFTAEQNVKYNLELEPVPPEVLASFGELANSISKLGSVLENDLIKTIGSVISNIQGMRDSQEKMISGVQLGGINGMMQTFSGAFGMFSSFISILQGVDLFVKALDDIFNPKEKDTAAEKLKEAAQEQKDAAGKLKEALKGDTKGEKATTALKVFDDASKVYSKALEWVETNRKLAEEGKGFAEKGKTKEQTNIDYLAQEKAKLDLVYAATKQSFLEALSLNIASLTDVLQKAFSEVDLSSFKSKFANDMKSLLRDAFIAISIQKYVSPAISALSDMIFEASKVTSPGGELITAEEKAAIDAATAAVTAAAESTYTAVNKLYPAVDKTTDSMNKLNGSLTNIPQGIKMAYNRFAAITAQEEALPKPLGGAMKPGIGTPIKVDALGREMYSTTDKDGTVTGTKVGVGQKRNAAQNVTVNISGLGLSKGEVVEVINNTMYRNTNMAYG